jgi:hypothetical protein
MAWGNNSATRKVITRTARAPGAPGRLLGALIAASVVSTAVALLSSEASGHLFHLNPKFSYFLHRTVDARDPTPVPPTPPPREKIDPVTVIFQGQPRNTSPSYTAPAIESFLEIGWKDNKMKRRLCNGRQRMVWRRDLTPEGRTSDKEDINMSTSSTCRNQVHSGLGRRAA